MRDLHTTYELRAHPGSTITLPRRLGGKAKSLINSAGNPTKFLGMDPKSGQPIIQPVFDPHAMSWECFLQCATHQDAGWNLKDEDGRPLSRDRATVEENEEYADDFLEIAAQHFQAMYGSDDQSAEGNAGGSSAESGEKPRPSPSSRARAPRS